MLDFGQIRPGAVFSRRYRVDRLLKTGGMGAVYAAENTATRKKVALKLMRPEIVASEAARARFAQEDPASLRFRHHAAGPPRRPADRPTTG